MKLIMRFVLVLALWSWTIAVSAQESAISGRVVASDGSGPVIGAAVYQTGDIGKGTVTDIDGYFSLRVVPGTMLTVSTIGYKSLTVAAENGMEVVLYPDSEFLDEVVVTGYTVQRKADLTGSVSVVDMDERTEKVHIGYCIGSKWWHSGYTSEAFAAILPFFFEQVGVKRVESQHDPNNPNSGLVMKKCGLIYEGTLRAADWSNKGIVDACMYGILASDYFSK